MSLFRDPISYLTELVPKGGSALDVGARGGRFTRGLRDAGYSVTAIDPRLDRANMPEGITAEATTLEAFASDKRFDLVFARLVEHTLRSKDTCTNLNLFDEYVAEHGTLYVTLFGENDAWCHSEDVEEQARARLEALGYDIVKFEGIEFEGPTYTGEDKHWHVLIYVAKKLGG